MAKTSSRSEKRSLRMLEDFASTARIYQRDGLSVKRFYDDELQVMQKRLHYLHSFQARCEKLEEQVATLQAQLIARDTP